jgi:hypothetical protein
MKIMTWRYFKNFKWERDMRTSMICERAWYKHMIWRHDIKTWYEDMIWRHDMKTWYEDMIWRHDMKTWYEDKTCLSRSLDMKTWYEDKTCLSRLLDTMLNIKTWYANEHDASMRWECQAHRDSIVYLVINRRRSEKWERKNENVRANKLSSLILAY